MMLASHSGHIFSGSELRLPIGQEA
jgi:hypothetical protein